MSVVIILCVTFFSYAESSDKQENPLWVIQTHNISNEKSYYTMNNLIKNGYFPAGIATFKSDISVLYYLAPKKPIKKWIFYEFTDLNKLNKEFSAFLLKGWFPIDISAAESVLRVLFVPSEKKVKDWKIIIIASLDALKAQHRIYYDKGYILAGMSKKKNGKYWVLFIKTKAESSPLQRSTDELLLISFKDLEKKLTEKLLQYSFPQSILQEDATTYFIRFFPSLKTPNKKQNTLK